MKNRENPITRFPLFRTFTARVMTVVMTTVIIFSVVLGLSVYFAMTG